MKLMNELAAKVLETSDAMTVEYISVLGGFKKLDEPIMSSEINCVICGGSKHYTPIAYPDRGPQRVRICGEFNCETLKSVYKSRNDYGRPNSNRAILWPLFCEISGIGDIHHDVKFENVDQTTQMKSDLKNFLTGTKPFLIMQGVKGTGKTYASMAICEAFTQTNTSCVFTTQKRMMNDWMDTFKQDKVSNYVNKITNTELLVIDDFGTGKVADGFMSFFMDLLNTRMQWKKRKTIITTNLDVYQLADICGDALMDRLKTGITLVFSGNSRR